ncbi:gamma-glutamyl-gamma-aminobutyrate hydrolase family protein [Streptomyces sp. NPDC048172]|uniref:gamma-glutamyl-gamma-aminobutyrate hydrolase family protein n=1 Tax=Streptomyces sp. NPDC048172 TaxID=3365505 RepID=UPI003723405F
MSPSAPLIGISTYLEPGVGWGVWRKPAALLPTGYHELVQRSGGQAVLLPPDGSPGAAAGLVSRLDAVITAGGPDVAPERYGAERDPRTGPAYPERDAWEIALTEAALDRGTPLLGICRGMQILNVARGGTLVQHMDGHRGPEGVFGAHPVEPVPGTLLGRVLTAPVDVPTYHHQSVEEIGEGLVPSAYAEDGTVEALELPDAPGFVLAVQWHPEEGDDLRLTEALVGAAVNAAVSAARGSA